MRVPLARFTLVVSLPPLLSTPLPLEIHLFETEPVEEAVERHKWKQADEK